MQNILTFNKYELSYWKLVDHKINSLVLEDNITTIKLKSLIYF